MMKISDGMLPADTPRLTDTIKLENDSTSQCSSSNTTGCHDHCGMQFKRHYDKREWFKLLTTMSPSPSDQLIFCTCRQILQLGILVSSEDKNTSSPTGGIGGREYEYSSVKMIRSYWLCFLRALTKISWQPLQADTRSTS